MDQNKPKNSNEIKKPHHYGKRDGVHLFHATMPEHSQLVGKHIKNPNDQELAETIAEAKKAGVSMVVIHGTPPESLRSKIHTDLGPMSPSQIHKSEGLEKAEQTWVEFEGHEPAHKKAKAYAQYHFTKPQLKHILDNWETSAMFYHSHDNGRADVQDQFHSTAIARKEAPAPIRDYMKKRSDTGKSILYHGVGRDEPGAKELSAKGKNRVEKYDPYHPDAKMRVLPKGKFDEVHSHYTLNVVNKHTGKNILQEIHDKLKDDGRAIISVRRDIQGPTKLAASENGKVYFQELQKAFLQPDLQTFTDIKAHTQALAAAHPKLMQWGTEKLSTLPKDAIESLDLDGKTIKVRKHDADLYSGWVEKDGNKLHAFEKITLPELMTQLQSKLELYGKEETVVQQDLSAIAKELHGMVRKYFEAHQLEFPGDDEVNEPSVDQRLKRIKSKIDSKMNPDPFNETKQDEEKEKQEFESASSDKREKMAFEELNELEDQIKQLHQEHQESVPKKELVPGMLHPERSCPDCGSEASFCDCYQGLPRPRLEFDGKKVVIFFKSEWAQEDRENFVEDLKLRAGQILKSRLIKK